VPLSALTRVRAPSGVQLVQLAKLETAAAHTPVWPVSASDTPIFNFMQSIAVWN